MEPHLGDDKAVIHPVGDGGSRAELPCEEMHLRISPTGLARRSRWLPGCGRWAESVFGSQDWELGASKWILGEPTPARNHQPTVRRRRVIEICWVIYCRSKWGRDITTICARSSSILQTSITSNQARAGKAHTISQRTGSFGK
ncbi:hypothetical protein SprV_0401654300 [Sparganum proliferum]